MDWNPQTPQFMSQSLLDTLSPQPELRRRAAENLSDPADTPNYALTVLRLVAEPSVEEETRQCAAVNFKNHFKTRWVPFSATPIPDREKEQIKTLIVPVMLSATRKIQEELREALTVIGDHEFPEFWQDLLPDLKSRLQMAINSNDLTSVNSILATVNSLFKRFRCEFNSLFKKFRYQSKRNTILHDLIYCWDNFAGPLFSTVESISRKMNAAATAAAGSVATLRQLLEARRLCCRIFYSLNYLGVPEEFDDKADEWMNEFKNYLTERYPGTEDDDCVDEVRTAVCENIILYMEQREEVFQKHLISFVEAVCSLLVVASGSASERLTVSGIKFLSIVSKSVDHELVGGDEILQRIVIPNMMLSDEDEELFEKNYVEFIKRDMEGNKVNTRRRIACELLKGKNKEKIRALIDHWLAVFDENPSANWKYKECAIYLVISLASISSDDFVVDVESFFRSVIVPELQQDEDVKGFPMLKVAALKFFTVFRVLIPKHAAMPLFGDVVRYVGSDVSMVRSYAAICMEKLLLVKDKDKNGLKQARYSSMDIDPIDQQLLYNLFDALENAPFLEENEYIVRCINRVLQMADLSSKMVAHCNIYLTKALNRPKTLVVTHFLFEAVSTLARRACEKNPWLVPDFQTFILHIFDRKAKTELYPYAFQLLAQLVDLNRPPSPLPRAYMQICDEIILSPCACNLWENSACVPALVHSLQSFLQQAPNELLINRKERLTYVVGKINKLVSSPDTEEEGFHLLNTVIENYGYDVIAEYMNHIWATVFTRLQNSKTLRLVRCVIICMSLFLVKHGVQTLVDLVNSVQVDSFHDVVLGEFWIPNLKTISTGYNYTEVKLSAVASTKLLCELASLLDPAAEKLWEKLLDAVVSLLSLPLQKKERAEDEDEPDLTASLGSRFVRLQNAGKKEEDPDPLEEIEDPKQFFVAFPANLSSEFHGRFPQVIMRRLSPPGQAALVTLCKSYNIAIV